MDVEGDYSQAAFLAVLGSTVGGITITGLPSGSHQGDRVILDILKQCGAKFERSGSHVTFHRSLLKAVEIDLADCPDLGGAHRTGVLLQRHHHHPQRRAAAH